MSEQLSLGARIRELRKAKNLSGEELGNIIGVKRGQVSAIENDKALITFDGCVNILSAYDNLNAEWLMLGKGSMNKENNSFPKEPVSSPDSSTCWEELEKEQIRYNQLLADYQALQKKVRDLNL